MAYVISDECVACGACSEECPVSAISEGDGKYVIDADVCVSCGACAGVCRGEGRGPLLYGIALFDWRVARADFGEKGDATAWRKRTL